ncbi:hypothetical protein [Fluviispira sanaruensis]|uniref:Uncharacterized protein n=1 Tax=Fluviispira sanaruensis TaxID=2493639 RepID=A0A4P2VNB1_FLUSA|nr:hypothetical protein [Fluviispira sanaruensis]BBH54348.1 hypothetical protein JCM31447_28120 [Fluviispira sanaruensis]
MKKIVLLTCLFISAANAVEFKSAQGEPLFYCFESSKEVESGLFLKLQCQDKSLNPYTQFYLNDKLTHEVKFLVGKISIKITSNTSPFIR